MRRGKSGRPWQIRGVMADPARLIERHEFYFELLERMAEWGLNTLWWHFADDEGFMLKLSSHPEIAGPHAFSKAQMRRLIARAAELGIDVVPEVEALGHTRYITALPKYAELADGDPLAFNAICPSHRRTLPLLEEIIREVADLFPSRYFHAGMDEVDLGGCPRCRRRGRGRPKWWIYAPHARAVHSIVRSAGKEMIIWADHVEKDPAMLKVLPRDIIMAHWHYRQVRREPIRRSLAAGFRVIGCPAMCHSGDVIMPNQANFANMDAMTSFLSRLPRPGRPQGGGVLGVVNTWWTIWRGLRDAYLPAVAYTGSMLDARSAIDKPAFMRRFAREFYGLTDAGAAGAMRELHALMIGRAELLACLFDSPAGMHDALKLAERDDFRRRGRRIDECTRTLRALARKPHRRRREFAALALAGTVAGLCCRRPVDLAAAFALYRQAKDAHDAGRPRVQVAGVLQEAVSALRKMQGELGAVVRAVAAEWDRTRYANDAKKKRLGRGDDALLARLYQAERFGAELTRQLGRAIRQYPRTGRFPGGV